MIDAFSILTSEMPPPSSSTDAPDATIQTTITDEVPKKVTTILSPFLSLQKEKNKHSFSMLLGSKKGSNSWTSPWQTFKKATGAIDFETEGT